MSVSQPRPPQPPPPLLLHRRSSTKAPASAASRSASHIPHGHELLISLLEETAAAAALSSANATVDPPHTPTSASYHSDSLPATTRRQSSFPTRKPSVAADLKTTDAPARKRASAAVLPPAPDHNQPPPPPAPALSKDVFSDPEYQAYLDHLTSCSLDALKNEPASLNREATRLQQQLADLAYTEYGSFLRANECTRSIRDTFTGLETRLASLTKTLPELEAACTSFASSSAQEVLKERRREHVVLNQHAKLVEILEIPQLMDTLIRNGYYDEAMDLQTHVQRLLLRHPNYRLLTSVAAELDAATKVMLTQLVNLLKGDVKLPLCIRVMGYLRRMEAVPEPELRLIFLQQRDKFFKKRVEEACGSDRQPLDAANATREHVEYVRKYVDVCRECFFDIVAQYRAIFSDATAGARAAATASAGASAAGTAASSSTLIYDTASHTTLTHSILSSYVVHRIQHLCATLQAHLPHVDDASQVASLCTQTMYFGMSLGRVGIDFRAVVAGLFEDAVEEIVRRAIGDGVDAFDAWIADMRASASSAAIASTPEIGATGEFGSMTQQPSVGVAIGSGVTHPFLKGIYVKHSAAPSARGSDSPRASTPTTPSTASAAASIVQAPTALLAHPPIAQLLNAFYTAYNHLRAMPTLALRARVASAVDSGLATAVTAFSDALALWWDGWNAQDRATAEAAVEAWCGVFVPAVVGGLEAIYRDGNAAGGGLLKTEQFVTALTPFRNTVEEESTTPAVGGTEQAPGVGDTLPPLPDSRPPTPPPPPKAHPSLANDLQADAAGPGDSPSGM
ncbi:conserved oligomeric Golgi complex component [Geranomyces variabilis]|uniref:Conserved oligomeric Golgi complex subunit 8 n=1 Tax=Geranomyces variabilis TaxID=109894 RepID=A0AAD5TNH9_9FUNG|nr:conserved oligomeric Golgi complex component [Geranomyces variabilis]